MVQTILVTGAAGFIGAALSQRLLQRGDRVVGLDNLNDYYEPALKQARLRQIEAVAPSGAWRFERMALEEGAALGSFSLRRSLMLWSIWRHRLACATRWRIPRLTSRATLWASATSSRAAVTTAWATWCMPRAVRYGGNRNLPFHETR